MRKILDLFLIFIMIVGASKILNAQSYSDINDKLKGFQIILDKTILSKKNDSNQFGDFKKKLQKKHDEIKDLMEQNRMLFTPDAKRNNPVSSYYVSTKFYLSLYQYDSLLENESCPLLQNLLAALKNENIKKNEGRFLRKDILIKRFKAALGKDLEELENMQIDTTSLKLIHYNHIKKIKTLCNECTPPKNEEADCDSLRNYFEELLVNNIYNEPVKSDVINKDSSLVHIDPHENFNADDKEIVVPKIDFPNYALCAEDENDSNVKANKSIYLKERIQVHGLRDAHSVILKLVSLNDNVIILNSGKDDTIPIIKTGSNVLIKKFYFKIKESNEIAKLKIQAIDAKTNELLNESNMRIIKINDKINCY